VNGRELLGFANGGGRPEFLYEIPSSSDRHSMRRLSQMASEGRGSDELLTALVQKRSSRVFGGALTSAVGGADKGRKKPK